MIEVKYADSATSNDPLEGDIFYFSETNQIDFSEAI